MIVYDSKRWNGLFKTLVKTFARSYNAKKLARFLAGALVYSSVITSLNMYVLKGEYKIDPLFFTIIGVILSLFLVFRINTSYDRWWEGSKTWHKIIADCRSLAMSFDGLIPESDNKRRNFFVKSLANFALALQGHLRDNIDKDKLIFVNRSYTETIDKAEHIPNTVLNMMFREIHTMEKDQTISDRDKTQLKSQLSSLVDQLTICERIQKTPIPFSHSTFIKIFAVIYIGMLPFGLVNAFGWLTIPAVVIMSFAMFGVEIISEEIENPFGTDANDLPTSHMADIIRENVYEILKVKEDFTLSKKKRQEAEVVL